MLDFKKNYQPNNSRKDKVPLTPESQRHVTAWQPMLGGSVTLVRTSDLWIRIQLWIGLVSSVTLRIPVPKKNSFFFIFFSYNLPAGT
jgi:hypothetical protein